jgi:hypothetical protein
MAALGVDFDFLFLFFFSSHFLSPEKSELDKQIEADGAVAGLPNFLQGPERLS